VGGRGHHDTTKCSRPEGPRLRAGHVAHGLHRRLAQVHHNGCLQCRAVSPLRGGQWAIRWWRWRRRVTPVWPGTAAGQGGEEPGGGRLSAMTHHIRDAAEEAQAVRRGNVSSESVQVCKRLLFGPSQLKHAPRRPRAPTRSRGAAQGPVRGPTPPETVSRDSGSRRANEPRPLAAQHHPTRNAWSLRTRVRAWRYSQVRDWCRELKCNSTNRKTRGVTSTG
jgi:hypothetical protein